jgi:hypothetical protein
MENKKTPQKAFIYELMKRLSCFGCAIDKNFASVIQFSFMPVSAVV